jgi:hypothetical protein
MILKKISFLKSLLLTRQQYNDGTHAMREASGKVTLTPGLHAVTIDFFQGGGGMGLQVS